MDTVSAPGQRPGGVVSRQVCTRLGTPEDQPDAGSTAREPVLSVVRVGSYDEGLELINANPYGNGTPLFTK